MKSLPTWCSLILLLMALAVKGRAGPVDTVHVHADSLKSGNILIGGSWFYHPGDDTAWADPGFDVSTWDTLNPRMDMDNMEPGKWTGIGWFRKSFKIDSSLLGGMLALRLEHFGASEIYLNGKKVHQYGRVSAFPDSEQVMQPARIPLAVLLDSSTTQTIAIRYSSHTAAQKTRWFQRWFHRAGFHLQVARLNSAIFSRVVNAQASNAVNFGIAGLFISLSILYLFLFLFFARKKENLFYSLFTLFISFIFMTSMLSRISASTLTFYYVIKIFSAFSISYVFLWYLGFLYSIFYEKFPKQFWLFLAIAIFISTSIFSYLPREIVNFSMPVFILLATLEGLRVIIIAMRQKKDNARVIGTGVVIFVGFVLMIFVLGIIGSNISSGWLITLFFVGLLSLPISMSVYLAQDIALTNKKLEEQIITIKDLTRHQIEQERKNAELKLQAELAEAENARKSKELEEARQLQLSMLPEEVPKLPDIEISVFMKTATEVGGDYYDFSVAKDGTLNIAFGDATGHGMQSGTLVSMMKALFTSEAARSDIQTFFDFSSRAIKQIRLGRLMMAFTLIKIKDHKFSLSSAGMPPVYIYRHETGEIEEVALQGMPLGAIKDFTWQVREGRLGANDSILLMTDGLPEMNNRDREQYGYTRIQQELKRTGDRPADEIIQHFVHQGEIWMNGEKADDDMTLMVVKMKN